MIAEIIIAFFLGFFNTFRNFRQNKNRSRLGGFGLLVLDYLDVVFTMMLSGLPL